MGLINNLVYGLIHQHQENKRQDVLNRANMYNTFLMAPDEQLAGMGYDPATARPWFAKQAQDLFEKEGGPDAKKHSGALFGALTAISPIAGGIAMLVHGLQNRHKAAAAGAGVPGSPSQLMGGQGGQPGDWAGEYGPAMNSAPSASPVPGQQPQPMQRPLVRPQALARPEVLSPDRIQAVKEQIARRNALLAQIPEQAKYDQTVKEHNDTLAQWNTATEDVPQNPPQESREYGFSAAPHISVTPEQRAAGQAQTRFGITLQPSSTSREEVHFKDLVTGEITTLYQDPKHRGVLYNYAGIPTPQPAHSRYTDITSEHQPSTGEIDQEHNYKAYAQLAGVPYPLTAPQASEAKAYFASDQMAEITRFRTQALVAKGMPFAQALAKARKDSIDKADRLPAAYINLQQTQEDAPKIAQGIKNGLISPMMTGLGRTGMAGRVTAELAKEGYDLAKAQKDWLATTTWVRTLNGPTQIRLRQATDFAVETLDLIDNSKEPGKDLLGDLRNAIPRTTYPIINKLALNAAKSGILGQPAAEAARLLEIQITDLQSELSTVYQGGNTPTDKSLGQAMKILSGEWDEKTLRGAVNLTRTNLGYRLNSIKHSPAMTEGGVEIGGTGVGQGTGAGGGPNTLALPKPSRPGQLATQEVLDQYIEWSKDANGKPDGAKVAKKMKEDSWTWAQ